MLASDIPYKFETPWAANATTGFITNPIPATAGSVAASQSLGFPPLTAAPVGSGGTPPNIDDINGGLFYETSWTRWVQAGAPVDYDAAFSTAIGGYPKGASVACAGCIGAAWLSTADNNTSNPDTGGANWLLQSNFPLLGTPLSSNTLLTIAQAGQFITVAGASTTQTLPAASGVKGMAAGFYASVPCTIASAGGHFAGTPLNGFGSAELQVGDWLCVQSDGSLWRVFSLSIPSLQFTSSVGDSGWMRRPDGIIEQWGFCGTASGGPSAVVFPRAFPTGAFKYSAIAGVLGASPAAANSIYVDPNSVSATGMNVLSSPGTSISGSYRVLGN